jgi:hypothetical protein
MGIQLARMGLMGRRWPELRIETGGSGLCPSLELHYEWRMWSVRVALRALGSPAGGPERPVFTGALLSLQALGPVDSKVERESATPVVVEFHGRYLEHARGDQSNAFTLIGTLAGTIEFDSSSRPVFRVAPDAEIVHAEATPAEGSLIRELPIQVDRAQAGDAGSPGAPLVMRLPSMHHGEPVGELAPRFFELTTILKVGGAEEAPLVSNDVLDILVRDLPVGPAVAALLPIVFRLKRSFPAAGALPMLRQLSQRLQSDPSLLAVVIGHTDEFGTDDENLTLSLQRAEATVAWLTGDAAFFEQQFQSGDESSRWGSLEALEMLEAVTRQGDFPPPLTSEDGELQRYQRSRGLAETGESDGPTVQQLSTDYVALLGAPVADKSRFTALGGGSFHAVQALGEEEPPPSTIPESLFFVHPRRVEVFLFKDRVTPPTESFKQTRAPKDPTYYAWCRRAQKTLGAPTRPLTIRVLGADGAPIAGAKATVFTLDGTDTPEEGTPLAASSTGATGVVSFTLAPGVYCVALEAEQGSRRLFCHVNRRLENIVDFAFFSPGGLGADA